MQRRVRGGAPSDREEHQDRVRRQVHQEEEGGDQPPRRRHGGHREGDPHPGRDGARQHHLPAPGLREPAVRHPHHRAVSFTLAAQNNAD